HVAAHVVRGHARHERIDAAAEEKALEGGNHLARGAQPAETDARAEDLRQRARADHAPARVERVERRQRLALEAQLAVGVVLEDEGLVLLGERYQGLPAS